MSSENRDLSPSGTRRRAMEIAHHLMDDLEEHREQMGSLPGSAEKESAIVKNLAGAAASLMVGVKGKGR